MSMLADLRRPKASLSIATSSCCRGGRYSFLWIASLAFGLYFIMVSVKRGGIKYYIYIYIYMIQKKIYRCLRFLRTINFNKKFTDTNPWIKKHYNSIKTISPTKNKKTAVTIIRLLKTTIKSKTHVEHSFIEQNLK